MSSVSVLMSVYNRAGSTGRTLAKYRQQTHEDFELLVVSPPVYQTEEQARLMEE